MTTTHLHFASALLFDLIITLPFFHTIELVKYFSPLTAQLGKNKHAVKFLRL